MSHSIPPDFLERYLKGFPSERAFSDLEAALKKVGQDKRDVSAEISKHSREADESIRRLQEEIAQRRASINAVENTKAELVRKQVQLIQQETTSLAEVQALKHQIEAKARQQTALSDPTKAGQYSHLRGLTVVDWEKPIVISRRMVEFQTLPGRHLVDPSSGGVVPLDFPALKIHAGAYGSGSYGNVGYYKATSPRGGRVNAGAYWHPHVHFETGEACLQDFATLILRAASAEDFLTVMSLVGDHLGSYNPLSPYTYLHDFVGRSQDPWHTPYCPSCKLSRVNCGCPKQAYQPSCVFCLAPMTPDNTSACGWCVSCCESHHRYSLVSANAHSGYNGTGCTTK